MKKTNLKLKKKTIQTKKYDFPFDKMKVGDSFYVSFTVCKKPVVWSYVGKYRALNQDKKFVSRQDKEGVRIWRTK